MASSPLVSGQKIGGICEGKMGLCEGKVKSGGKMGKPSSPVPQDAILKTMHEPRRDD